jgi:hypothetical protein
MDSDQRIADQEDRRQRKPPAGMQLDLRRGGEAFRSCHGAFGMEQDDRLLVCLEP